MRGGGIIAAGFGLVAAVWVSLQLSQATAPDLAGPAPAVLADVGTVPGFRAEAWYLPDDDMLGFVEIPAGPFLMGSDPDVDPAAFDLERWSTQARQGTVELPTFYIGRYEVTVAQYTAFVTETGHAVVDGQALRGDPDHPVSSVSWTDALAYTRWLERVLATSANTPPALTARLEAGWKVGLPTEAQWEKAARGSDGRIFSWGDAPRRDRANFASGATSAVGSFECPECPYPISDMSGNVWEWTASPYQPYPYDPADDSDDLASEALWVMRGGSFGDGPQFLRAANRGGADPGARRAFIGFRVALSPPSGS